MNLFHFHPFINLPPPLRDALAARSPSSSVVQFVDFAVKLIWKGNQYYKSADGNLEENAQLKDVADNFGKLSGRLVDSTRSFPTARAADSGRKGS